MPYITSVSVENFKSFRDKDVIPLPARGFLCIAGANGAGKSNLLDAVCFALGAPPILLRAKKLSDLVHSPKIRTLVELTIVQDSGEKVRAASIVVEGSRFYLWNGSRTPKNRFDEILNGLGLSLGNSGTVVIWRMTQSDNRAELSAPALFECLCHVSGAKSFEKKFADAQKRIVEAKASLVKVQGGLNSLRSQIEKEKAILFDDESVSNLQEFLRVQLPEQKASISARLHALEAEEWRTKECESTTMIEDLDLHIADLQSCISTQEASLIPSTEPLKAESKLFEAQQMRFRDATAALYCHKNKLQELKENAIHFKAFHSSLRALSASIHAKGMIEKPNIQQRCDRLKNKLRVMQERLLSLEASSEVERISGKDIFEESLEELKSIHNTTKDSYVRATQKVKDAHSKMLDLVADADIRINGHDVLQDRCTVLSAKISDFWKSSSTEIENYNCSSTQSSDFGISILSELERKMHEFEIEASKIEARIKSASAKLSCWVPDAKKSTSNSLLGGGYLFQSIKVKETHMIPLDCILAPSLCVQIFDTTTASMLYAEEAKKCGLSARIWSLDRIDVPRGSLARRRFTLLEKIRTKLPDLFEASKVIDPITLIDYDKANPAIAAALTKAISNWMIVDSDETAKNVLFNSAENIRAITFAGNIHSMGNIMGGWRGNSKPEALRIRIANDLRSSIVNLEQNDLRKKNLHQTITNLKTTIDMSWKLRDLELQLEVSQQALEIAKYDARQATDEATLADAQLRVAETEMKKAKEGLESRLQEAPLKETDATDIIDHTRECLRREYSIAETSLNENEEDLLRLEDEIETMKSELRPEEPDVEERITLAAKDAFEKASCTGIIYHCPTATLSACDLAKSRLDEEVASTEKLLAASEFAVSSISDEIEKVAAQREEAETFELQKQTAIQSLKLDVLESERSIQDLRNKVKKYRDSAARCQSKAKKDHPEASSLDQSETASMEELNEKMDALNAKENLSRTELGELKRKISKAEKGKCQVRHVNPTALKAKVDAVDLLHGQMIGIEEAIKYLENGMEDAAKLTKSTNKVCFDQVNSEFQRLVSILLPGRTGRLDLIMTGDNPAGITIKISLSLAIEQTATDSISDMDASNTNEFNADSAPMRREHSATELSGGEKALIGLALTCAMASFKKAPCYLLDEIDAAMDECNQKHAATVIKECLSGSQIFCVSHHPTLQQNSDQMIEIARHKGGTSKYLRCIKSSEVN